MRLVRFGEAGRERPGLLRSDARDDERDDARDDDTIIDLSSVVTDLDPRFWGEGGVAFVAGMLPPGRGVGSAGLETLPAVKRDAVRLGPPVASPGKIICVGRNYAEHAKESGAAVPKAPVLFSKAATALSGPNDDIVLPRDEMTTDWEVELAFVVGRRARRVTVEDAMGFVAGFTIMNDVSERGPQKSEGQWHRAKSFDTYAPLGPWVGTPDEVIDPGALELWTDVNGARMQESSTADLIFGVAALVEFITRGMTLMPGDIVSTGTPPGVGAFRHPPVFLKEGDTVELGVSKLGRQRCRVVREPG